SSAFVHPPISPSPFRPQSQSASGFPPASPLGSGPLLPLDPLGARLARFLVGGLASRRPELPFARQQLPAPAPDGLGRHAPPEHDRRSRLGANRSCERRPDKKTGAALLTVAGAP